MSIKICFYSSVIDGEKGEVDLLKYYGDTEDGHCIYKIDAGEICSEFIARYFQKVETMPKLLLNKVIEENYNNQSQEEAMQDMQNGIFRLNINTMIEDNNEDFEFKIYKECKIVREKLLDIYIKMQNKLKEKTNKSEIETYALLTI